MDNHIADGGKRNEFDGIQSLVVRGLLYDTTWRQPEEFLRGLALLEEIRKI